MWAGQKEGQNCDAETPAPGCAALPLLVKHQSSLFLSMKGWLSCMIFFFFQVTPFLSPLMFMNALGSNLNSNKKKLSGILPNVFAAPDTGYWLMPVKWLTPPCYLRGFFYYVRSKSSSHSISCLQLLLLICCFYDTPSLMSARCMTGAVVKVLVFTGYVYIHLILQKGL